MTYIFILWLAIAYIFGSINNGVVVSKLIHKKDVRDFGSKASGTTNTLRTFGPATAAAVLILDILKPIIPIMLSSWLTPHAFDNIIGGKAWIGFFAVLGQCYPVFFGFRGGKGIASALGTLIVLAPKVLIIDLIVFVVVAFFGNMISLASIIAVLVNFPFTALYYSQYLLPIAALSTLILWRHRKNMVRIVKGEENKLRKKKTDKE